MLFTSEKKYLPLVQQVSKEFNVPAALILGHAKQESNFDPKAYRAEPKINDASYGLMQVLLKTAKSIEPNATPDRLYDPLYSLRIGTAYIGQNLKKFGNVPDAVAAYNSGVAKKDTYGRYVSNSGTNVQPYVDKVIRNYNMYDDWLNKGANIIELSIINPLEISLLLLSGFSLIFILGRTKWKK